MTTWSSQLRRQKLNNTRLLGATDGNHIIENRMRAVAGYCESETCTKPLNQETPHIVGMCYGKIVLAYIEDLWSLHNKSFRFALYLRVHSKLYNSRVPPSTLCQLSVYKQLSLKWWHFIFYMKSLEFFHITYVHIIHTICILYIHIYK